MSQNKEKQAQNVVDNRLFDKIAKHPWRYFFGGWVIALLIAILFFELPIFVIPTKKGIEPTDWLLFLGSFFSFIGTLFLGIVAIRQNEKLTEINRGLENLEQERFKYEKQKLFSYLNIDHFEFTNDCTECTENFGFTIYFPEGAIKKKAGSDYKEAVRFKIYLKCITETPIQHIHISHYNMELKAKFGDYTINTSQDSEIQKDNVYVKRIDNCCMQKDERIPFFIRFDNIKMETGQVSQIQSLKGEIGFECSSLYNMSSFMTLEFNIGLKNNQTSGALTEYSDEHLKMTYRTECNEPTNEKFFVNRL